MFLNFLKNGHQNIQQGALNIHISKDQKAKRLGQKVRLDYNLLTPLTPWPCLSRARPLIQKVSQAPETVPPV